MPRHAIGERAMTATERSARRRWREEHIRRVAEAIVAAHQAGGRLEELLPLVEQLRQALQR
jgi:hypothetical protein